MMMIMIIRDVGVIVIGIVIMIAIRIALIEKDERAIETEGQGVIMTSIPIDEDGKNARRREGTRIIAVGRTARRVMNQDVVGEIGSAGIGVGVGKEAPLEVRVDPGRQHRGGRATAVSAKEA